MIYDQLNWSCRELVSNCQFGFIKGRSTVENLVSYKTDLLEALEKGHQVDAIYTDFSKAFDRVNFDILLSKLSALGFSHDSVLWLRSFLIGRTQSVKIGGHISDKFNVTSGVPQGSHCAPILFTLFVNDISDVMSYSKAIMFADDLKIYRTIKDVGDSAGIQNDLDALWQWTQRNHLYLNIEKCFCISFFKTKRRICTVYSLNNDILTYMSTAKDLGMLFDERLSFVDHICKTSLKAMQMLGFVWRNCKDFSTNTFRTLYCSLVRPNLEYATVVWSP
nr:unnamed protein product [Callosobruchus analis]